MNQRRFDVTSDFPEEDLGLITEADFRSTRSRAAERVSLELRPQSFGTPYSDRNETGESYLQDLSLHRHCSNLSRLQHQFQQQQGCQKERTQSTSAIPSPDVESFQLFDITHQSLWGSFPESCGPCAPSMTGSACSSGSMLASATSLMLGLEEISCCGDSRATLERLGRFCNNRSLSDITLKVGSRSFRSHRLVLVNTSDVFERMFCSRDWRESSRLELELHEEPDCERVFGFFLKFLYSRSISLNIDNTLPMLALADKYNVEDLKQVCLRFAIDHVLSRIQLKEVFHLWFQYAVRNGHRILTSTCVALLAEKAEELIFSPEWESEWLAMDREQLVEILKSSDLVVKDEKDVWTAVQMWINRFNSHSRNGCGVVESGSDKQQKNFSSEPNSATSGTSGGITLGRSFNQDFPHSTNMPKVDHQQEEDDLRALLPHIRFAMMSANQLCEVERSSLAERHPELFMRYINLAYKYLSLPLTARTRMPEFSGPAFLLRNYLDLRWDKRLVISNFQSYGDRSEVLLRFSTLACTVPAQSWEWELKVYPRGSSSGLSYIVRDAGKCHGECRMILSSNVVLDQHPRPLEFQLGIVVSSGQQQKELVLINGRKNFSRGRFSSEPMELDQRLSLNQLADQFCGRDEVEEAGGCSGSDGDGGAGGESTFLIDGSLILQVTFKPIND